MPAFRCPALNCMNAASHDPFTASAYSQTSAPRRVPRSAWEAPRSRLTTFCAKCIARASEHFSSLKGKPALSGLRELNNPHYGHF